MIVRPIALSVMLLCVIQLVRGDVNVFAHARHSRTRQSNVLALGNDTLISHLTVHGAVIVSDHFVREELEDEELEALSNSTQSLRETPTPLSESDQQKLQARSQNLQLLQSQLPFVLSKWSAVIAGPCPIYPNRHTYERGLLWAHYRVWRDFVHFDEDVLDEWRETNSTVHSKDGVYTAFANGTLIKRQRIYQEDDILVIFEDDATSSIDRTAETVVEELTDMNVDVLFLGWCEGRMARPVPLCTHAYAITRRAARKLVHYIEPCGRSVDEQIVILAKNNWLTYRRARGSSFQTIRKDFQEAGLKTMGIFRQCKHSCGSLIGH